jgi:hypothetical protein
MFWVGLMDGDGSIQINHWLNNHCNIDLLLSYSILHQTTIC